MQTELDKAVLKNALKEAFAETLHEERNYLHEVIADVMEGVALEQAIDEGLRTDGVNHAEVFATLESSA